MIQSSVLLYRQYRKYVLTASGASAYQCAMSTPIPAILPKLLALAGSSQPYEATAALRMARVKLGGDWSVVEDLTKWSLGGEERKLTQLLDRAATAESDQGVKALNSARRLMRTVPGLDFEFLSRKLAELAKSPRAIRIASPTSGTRPKRRPAKSPKPKQAWDEVFMQAASSSGNPERERRVRAKRPSRVASPADDRQIAFCFGD